MTTKTIQSYENSGEFTDFFEMVDNIDNDLTTLGRHTVYVQTTDGTLLSGARIEQETLSDGSVVYNLVLVF